MSFNCIRLSFFFSMYSCQQTLKPLNKINSDATITSADKNGNKIFYRTWFEDTLKSILVKGFPQTCSADRLCNKQTNNTINPTAQYPVISWRTLTGQMGSNLKKKKKKRPVSVPLISGAQAETPCESARFWLQRHRQASCFTQESHIFESLLLPHSCEMKIHVHHRTQSSSLSSVAPLQSMCGDHCRPAVDNVANKVISIVCCGSGVVSSMFFTAAGTICVVSSDCDYEVRAAKKNKL